MKLLTQKNLEIFLKSLEKEFDVRVPIRLHDKTRAIGKLDEGPLAVMGGCIPQKITNIFFPQMETMLTVSEKGVKTPAPPERPLLVLGFTAQDADSLEFIDRFFSANFWDDLYFNRRQNAVIICVSGRCGPKGEFLKIAGEKCDIELICDEQNYIITGYTETGRSLVESIRQADPVSPDVFSLLQKESNELDDSDLMLIRKASGLLLDDKVPDEFWQHIADCCIACTSCNLACPTCTCFDVFDRRSEVGIQRWRIWDSCQLDGFMREASGYNPMGKEHVRTRRRIHHKLASDVIRWGYSTCFLCGRCDRVCPTGIGIKAVCRELVEKYGSV
ncbi:MAG: 4Fe-4S dicluster domain-containing protein [Planctomycetota bacterium]